MHINNRLIVGEIREIKPFIFAVIIKDNYDRAMLFCRYQEFYESPFYEIRGKFFTLEEYMKLYISKNKKQIFTYPTDWIGFNIPSNSLFAAQKTFAPINSLYDYTMNEIVEYCEKESSLRNNGESHPWYLIGIDKLKSRTMNHEIAHGLYYTNLNYKVEMDYFTGNIPLRDSVSLKEKLIKVGYANDGKILDDEIQAFMSTGKLEIWANSIYEKYSKDYITTFKKFTK